MNRATWKGRLLGAALCLFGSAAFAQTPPAAIEFDPSNALLAEWFGRVALQSENRQGIERPIVKWAAPVRIGVMGDRVPIFRPFVERHVQLLRRITGHDIQVITAGQANFVVVFTPDIFAQPQGNVRNAMRALMGGDDAALEAFVANQPRTANCYFNVRGGGQGIAGALAVIPSQRDPSTAWRCIVEEITQSLGLFNDSELNTYSIFNDRTPYVDLTPPDEMMLKLLYEPRMRIGTPPADAKALARRLLDEWRPGR
ncbi:MAG: DUF2927 domain-containing protein [Alphaproteobacteria bacterium]|nr:DUF2927 domain-containing protein [Alphaproteobacteria bacterium]